MSGSESRATGHFLVPSPVGREHLCRVLDRSDLLVLPSHVEAFGTAALEGMARGRNLCSALISGHTGEHLALDRLAIGALIGRSYAWFRERDLGAPDLYVRPAWAMGDIGRPDLRQLPFRRYETLSGVYAAVARRCESALTRVTSA